MNNLQKRENLIKKYNTFYEDKSVIDVPNLVNLEYLLKEYNYAEKYTKKSDNGFKYAYLNGINNWYIEGLFDRQDLRFIQNKELKVSDKEFYLGLKKQIIKGANDFNYTEDNFLDMLVDYLYTRDFSGFDFNQKDRYRFFRKIYKIADMPYGDFKRLLEFIEEELDLDATLPYKRYERKYKAREEIRKRGVN